MIGMTRHAGTASVALMVTLVLVAVPTVSPKVRLAADRTALILGGTSGPTPDDTYIDIVASQFIAPTHPGQDVDYVAVTTPEELWPVTGLLRLVGFALGDRRLFGPGGMAWPDEPLWKLSGLFDLTADRSVEQGAADLEDAVAEHGNGPQVISGYSQGAGVANVVKRRLAEQYPTGTTAPDIDFVLIGDPNLPNGGLMSRFAGLHIPILDFTFNGPAATNTQFDTVEISRQYDGFTDFPLYPLNLIADLNAVLGMFYVHTHLLDVSLPADPTTLAYQGTHGDTSYYLFKNADLPLFGPLRTLGVPEKLIDVVEPFFRVIVEAGYDRSIKPWEPTRARLIPKVNAGKVITDLANAIGEGVNDALALVGAPPVLVTPAPAAESVKTARTASTRAAFDDTEQPLSPNETETIEATSTASDVVRPSLRPRSEGSATRALTPRQVKPVGRSARPGPAARDSLGDDTRTGEHSAAASSAAASSTGASARRSSISRP